MTETKQQTGPKRSTSFRNIVAGGALMSLCLLATAMSVPNAMASSKTDAHKGRITAEGIRSTDTCNVKVHVNGETKTIKSDSDALKISTPAPWAVYQRGSDNSVELPVECVSPESISKIRVRVLARGSGQQVVDWTNLEATPSGTAYIGKLKIPAGWYALELQGTCADGVTVTKVVEPFGVGELFITCGQSNSANHGAPPYTPKDERVVACHYKTGVWRHADDPQPGASGKGGSPWSRLGDLFVKKYDVPVGFISVGVGSTYVKEWSGWLYPLIKGALAQATPNKPRAILWHQGESDSLCGTKADVYAKNLTGIIERSRKHAGQEIPWGIALASWHPERQSTAENQAEVIAGQKQVIEKTPNVFKGPETDTYHAKNFLCDGVHFNEQGLSAHAEAWLLAIQTIIK